MKKILYRGLRQHVIAELGQRIISGELEAGAPLPGESQLCKTLGVSRTALREALRELAAKGLVDAKPRIGTVVRTEEHWNFLDLDVLTWRLQTKETASVLAELYELRQLIEPVAAFLAANNATQEQIELLREAYADMLAAGEDGEKYTAPDIKFHSTIIAASGNKLFGSLARSVSAALRINFDYLEQPPRGHAYFMKGHKDVLDAICRGDSVAARVAMQSLLKDSHEDAMVLGSKTLGRARSKARRIATRIGN